MKQKLLGLKLQMARLCIFKSIQELELIRDLEKLVEDVLDENKPIGENIKLYNGFAYNFYKEIQGKSLKAYILDEILYGQNLINLHIERQKELSISMVEALRGELAALQAIGEVKAVDLKACMCHKAKCELEKEIIHSLLEWENESEEEQMVLGYVGWGEKADQLLDFYRNKGCGIFAKYKAFIWADCKGRKEIKGIGVPDSIIMDDLIGYHLQKQDLLHNTEAFLKGYPANNLLLYGARGTGKSSMIKAVLNYFAPHTRLRLVEMRKDQLMQLKELINEIKDKPYYFIIFIDDLAFEDKEETYTALKTILEGGVEAKPSHVIIYATSNRRHLIEEKISDNELHGKDTVEEKMSLSDRFGMRIGFNSPNQLEYLAIVNGLVKQRGLGIEEEILKKEALKWEMWHNGKSGRTAKQFVDDLESQEM